MGCSPGDPDCFDDERPQHTVRITKGFWVGQTEVTQAAYQKVIRSNPSHFKGENLPVEQVSWEEAKRYCRAIGGRLPTEAEWEYAARAGSPGARYGDLDAIAWYPGNSQSRTHEAKTKQPNALGLYDTLGNVWEWVEDWYHPDYYQRLPSPALDPPVPVSGESRVVRGGSWGDVPRVVRVSLRYRNRPEFRYSNIGFRCVREVIP
jgi:formylglycine-generating enzyme required for sulfatase activity